MTSEAPTVEVYIDELSPDRAEAVRTMRETLRQHLPDGFEEAMSYGMPGFVVPLSRYPDGYHCKADTPLPFISYASQKNFVALYHMGIYALPAMLAWFQDEAAECMRLKLDMGKSCVRFKRMDDIPFDLIGELAGKMTVDDWIGTYESTFKR